MHTMCNCEFTQPYIVSLIDCAVTACLHCTPVYFQEVSTFKGQDIYTTLTCCVRYFNPTVQEASQVISDKDKRDHNL